MTEAQILDTITSDLVNKHDCHTVILYGSRARGDANSASDYDVMGVRKGGEEIRDARIFQGAFLDLFVYPEAKLSQPPATMLHMRKGRVLYDKGNFAATFFAKLDKLHAEGPRILPQWEIEVLRVWHRKALARIRLGGIEGNLRRAELVPAILEHYYQIRGEWYEGAKTAFKWLKENRPLLFAAVERALEPNASVGAFEELVELFESDFMREAKPAPEKASQLEQPERPDYIKHYSEIQESGEESHYPGSEEFLSVGSPFGKKFGLQRIGIHHEVLPPGRRTSWPHAESTEEEFVYVIEGTPDVWLNGYLHRLQPGDAVGFPSGTGISHSFLNNTSSEVRLLVVGERSKKDNRIYYPLHPVRREQCRDSWWHDVPRFAHGSHDGLPDQLRGTSAKGALNYTGEIIVESLENHTALDALEPFQIKSRTVEMPNEKIKHWNVRRFCVNGEALREVLPLIERTLLPGWYVHFFSDLGDELHVSFRGQTFLIGKKKDERWDEMIRFGESVGVERRWTESIPTSFTE